MTDRYEGPTAGDYLQDVSLFDLMEAVRAALERMPEEKPFHLVEQVDTTMEQQMEVLLAEFGDRSEYPLSQVFARIERRIILILTFIAILELVRVRRVVVRQKKHFGELVVQRR